MVEPVLQKGDNSIIYINFSQDDYKLGGSSFAQTQSQIGQETPTIKNSLFFKKAFNVIQDLIKQELITAGHDISAGGLIITLLEMCFADSNLGAEIDLTSLNEKDSVKLLFAENSGIVFQTKDKTKVENILNTNKLEYFTIGSAWEFHSSDPNPENLTIINHCETFVFNIATYRNT